MNTASIQPRTLAFLCTVTAALAGCSSSERGNGKGAGGGDGTAGAFATPDASTHGASGGTSATGGYTGSGVRDADSGALDPTCSVTGASEAALIPVRLAFVFDVSASMGQLDNPYHDPELKWEPVVASTKAFFADPESAGISASLTFFPIDADDDERCDSASYEKPDVPVTALPSDAFAQAIDDITPHSKDEWRSGTPTLAAVGATLDLARAQSKANPGDRHAVVLVSDGYPQGCDDDDIDSVASAVAKALPDIETYVIGVSNPPGGPDTVSNLNAVAQAGGTDHAYLVETGDPERTKSAFLDAVRAIRTGTLSCAFQIPEPPAGESFDRGRANVSDSNGVSAADFVYDPDCKSAQAWRYDDPDAPTHIVLCDETCAAVRRDAKAVLRVEFGCARREVVR